MRWIALLLPPMLLACDGGTPEEVPDAGWQPEFSCPNDNNPDCLPSGDTSLRAAAAVRSITPTCFEQWVDLDGNAFWDERAESFLDCGCDHLCGAAAPALHGSWRLAEVREPLQRLPFQVVWPSPAPLWRHTAHSVVTKMSPAGATDTPVTRPVESEPTLASVGT